VAGIGTHAEACDLSINLRPTLFGVLEFLEQKHRRPFPHDESFAVEGKRPAGLAGISIANGQHSY